MRYVCFITPVTIAILSRYRKNPETDQEEAGKGTKFHTGNLNKHNKIKVYLSAEIDHQEVQLFDYSESLSWNEGNTVAMPAVY